MELHSHDLSWMMDVTIPSFNLGLEWAITYTVNNQMIIHATIPVKPYLQKGLLVYHYDACPTPVIVAFKHAYYIDYMLLFYPYSRWWHYDLDTFFTQLTQNVDNGQWYTALMASFWLMWICFWANNGEAGKKTP